MVLYQSVVSPSVVVTNVPIVSDLWSVKLEETGLIPNDRAKTDYGLFKTVFLHEPGYAVYLKRIRFVIVHEKQNQAKYMNFPYQIHIRLLDGKTTPYLNPGVIQNTQHHDPATGDLLLFPTPSTASPHYSTFCIESHTSETVAMNHEIPAGSYYLHHDLTWKYYDMERNVLLRTGQTNSFSFEVYFTNVEGLRYYRHLPNVELEFEVI